MPDLGLVNVSRLQFAVTAPYHFLFVPLTLGLSWILVIMESVYMMTGRETYHLYGWSNDGSRKNPRGGRFRRP